MINARSARAARTAARAVADPPNACAVLVAASRP